ncbi:SGNH/GDSL hydrolase family protein [Nonomuraea aridisoli]|uniref:SGNH hydrolase-type esterase domain-containing protein n=1 Tax=Nonomuraea aridisoli TaxID=2070368 RepID=A0A2W2FZA3_9ACTN|nr:SGNH/GDSL hydrolase family protein [Nonomuraea aridisoli]PZG20084.1 hypothetical protein C1J01_10420 [Nonomuraea aridisoli]
MKKLLILLTAALGATAGTALALPAAQAATGAPLRIVALGDSYGSGTGAGDYEPGTEGSCWRSAGSAAELIAKDLAARGRKVALTNVTCSGATSASLSREFKGRPPQLDALRRTTDVVMLTIGATDVDFSGYGGICLQADCSGPATTATLGKLPAMGADVRKLLAEIKRRSPRAQIVMTGYGAQLTRGANAPGVPLDPICGPDVATPAERVAGESVMVALDTTLRRAALAARSRHVNVTYVSPYKAPGVLEPTFRGHSLCESADPYYRGFDALADGQEGPDAVFHLNRKGQAAMAALVRRAVPALAVHHR